MEGVGKIVHWLPDAEVVIRLHQMMIDRSGGSHGVRDLGLIESAIARASAAFGGIEAYPDILSKAAAMGCGLAQNHGFVDGNKRIGMAVMLLILRRNGIVLSYTQDELIAVGLSVAQNVANVTDILNWIKAHIINNSTEY